MPNKLNRILATKTSTSIFLYRAKILIKRVSLVSVSLFFSNFSIGSIIKNTPVHSPLKASAFTILSPHAGSPIYTLLFLYLYTIT